MRYVVARVATTCGHSTFRAWFGDSTHPGAGDEVVQELQEQGYELEWYSKNLLAIDASDDDRAQQLADMLMARERLGHLVYETGRTA